MTTTIGQTAQGPLDIILAQLGQGVGQGVGEGISQKVAQFHEDKKLAASEKSFVEQGFPPQLAKLAAGATTGGQTEVLKNVLEMMQRSGGEAVDPSQVGEQVGAGEVPRTPKEEVAHQEKKEERSFQRNKKYLERISDISNEIPKEDVALAQMGAALEDKDFNSLRNVVADVTGNEWLKTASAQTVNSASKQFLMSSLASLTGRPNQFIERQITKALVSPQYRDTANELIFEGLGLLSDIRKKEVEIAQRVEEDYTDKGKEIPRNFQKKVTDELKEYSTEREKAYEDLVREKLRGQNIKEEDFVIMLDPTGAERNVSKKDAKRAQEAGYRLSK